MKAAIDANTCTGCTLCADIAAAVFEMGDDGIGPCEGRGRARRRGDLRSGSRGQLSGIRHHPGLKSPGVNVPVAVNPWRPGFF